MSLNQDGGVYGFVEERSGFVYTEELTVEHAFDFAAGLVGIAMRVEYLLDVGAFGPLPEQLFLLGIGAGFFEGETLLFDGEAFGRKIAAAESREVVAEIAKAAEFEFGIFVDGREGAGNGGVTDLEAADEFGAHFFEGGLREIVGEGVFGEGEGGLGELPSLEPGFFPVRQIFGANGQAFEFSRQNGLFHEFLAVGYDVVGEVEDVGEFPGLLHVFEGAGVIFGDEEVIALFEAEAFADVFEGVGVSPADADGFFGEGTDLAALGVEMVLGFDPADLMMGEVLFEDGIGIEFERGEEGGHGKLVS
jgi:hypothetical protein